VRNFSYKSPQIPNEIKIANAKLNFNQGNVKVPELLLTTGQTDMKASGTIQNLMGFLFTDQDLKGDFQVNSNTFAVSDFMVAKSASEKTNSTAEKKPSTTTSDAEAIKIPSFLDTRLDFNVNRVLYDNLVLNNTKGTLIIKDETATLKNVTSNIFNGGIALNGEVSTKNPTPTFQMDLDLNQLDIASSFNGLELLQNLAPVAKALQGKLQTNIKLKGNLHNDLTPNLSSLTGNALAQILTAKVDPEKLPLLASLDQQLKFIDLNKLNLDNLKTQLTFSDGMVKIHPFDFKVEDINVQVSGSHGFDMQMNYDLKLDVPAKYLGNEVGGGLAKLTGEQVNSMSVALPIGLTGTFQNPQINLNMQQAITNLTQQIVQKQKEKLLGQGEKAIQDIITQKTGGKADTTKTPKNQQNRLPDITDTTTTTDQKVQEAAKSILGGILKNAKKMKDTTKQ
ncbi:MAG: AsmA-like C-terminal region-containing protein, partial [Salegentibacter sp.]